MSDLDTLRTLGDRLTPPPFETLRRTARHRSRRTAGAVVAAGASAAVVAAGFVLLVGGDEDGGAPLPGESPSVTTSAEPATNVPRELVYSVDRTIHYGARTVTAPAWVAELDVTDDGTLFRTDTGTIGFTDGFTVDDLDTLGNVAPEDQRSWPGTVSYPNWTVTADSGSLAAWFHFPGGRPELVVFDTHTRTVVARTDVPRGGDRPEVLATIAGGRVYWFSDASRTDAAPDTRFDPVTGEITRITPAEYQAEMRREAPERSLLVGDVADGPPSQVSDGELEPFVVAEGRVRPESAQRVLQDRASGVALDFAAPQGYPSSGFVVLVQWLDDDTVVLMSNPGGYDDLLTCHFSTQTCELPVRPPASAVVPALG